MYQNRSQGGHGVGGSLAKLLDVHFIPCTNVCLKKLLKLMSKSEGQACHRNSFYFFFHQKS